MNTNLIARSSESLANRVLIGAFNLALIGAVGVLTFAHFMTFA